MFKVCIAEKRAVGVAVDGFQECWQAAYETAADASPLIRRCVLDLPLPQGYRKRDLVFDGFAELWFEDGEAHRQWLASDARAALCSALAGVAQTEDRIECPVAVRLIKDGVTPSDSLKIVEFINRRPDLPVPEFQRYWWREHGPLAAAIPQLRRYEQNHLTDWNYAGGEPRYDGFAVTWFGSTDAMRESAKTPEFTKAAEDEHNFLAPTAVEFIICTERTVRA